MPDRGPRLDAPAEPNRPLIDVTLTAPGMSGVMGRRIHDH